MSLVWTDILELRDSLVYPVHEDSREYKESEVRKDRRGLKVITGDPVWRELKDPKEKREGYFSLTRKS